MPRDRVYFRYNHFQAATEVDIFSDSPMGSHSHLNIDRFTFGLEKTFFNGQASVEVRVPFSRELNSNIDISDIQGVLSNIPLEDYALEFGNVSVIGKVLLWSTPTFSAMRSCRGPVRVETLRTSATPESLSTP